MADTHKLTRAAAGAILDKTLKYVDKNPEENIIKLVDRASGMIKGMFPPENFEKIKAGLRDPDNVYRQFALDIIRDIDKRIIKNMILSMGIEAALYGTKTVRENREKYDCNIPWLILFDPTSACNMKCKGCWAAEYGYKQNLTYEEMKSIVSQGKALGTHFYMMTGGEPLIRKDDIIRLCEENPDCAFMAFTNGTLVDQKLCDDMLRVGNFALALSVEGTEESNDLRRGGGAYSKTLAAMDLLHKNKCLFGISVCYTRQNDAYVTSDEFLDLMVEKGAKYGLYFNYMPVGHDADKDFIPTPQQRKYMYEWIRRVRNSKTGKRMFIFDFQDDGEYVGGCIAGGRRYFHINSAGDMEPCVFIHYSDSNIRTHTILEALRRPLFMAYNKGQPFNDNHLRPCPMLENPQILRKMVKETGAKSTDLLVEEDVDTLCGRCDQFALEWAPVAEEIWNTYPHKKTHTEYYRDRHPEEFTDSGK